LLPPPLRKTMTKVWQCGVQAGNEEWRHREPHHKYRMKQNVQCWKDEKGQLGEEEVPET
jgi:hypothetical protein